MPTMGRWMPYAAALVVFAIVVGLFAGLMTTRSADHREEFKQDCLDAGGRVVELRHRIYCVVDGEKMEF